MLLCACGKEKIHESVGGDWTDVNFFLAHDDQRNVNFFFTHGEKSFVFKFLSFFKREFLLVFKVRNENETLNFYFLIIFLS